MIPTCKWLHTVRMGDSDMLKSTNVYNGYDWLFVRHDWLFVFFMIGCMRGELGPLLHTAPKELSIPMSIPTVVLTLVNGARASLFC